MGSGRAVSGGLVTVPMYGWMDGWMDPRTLSFSSSLLKRTKPKPLDMPLTGSITTCCGWCIA